MVVVISAEVAIPTLGPLIVREFFTPASSGASKRKCSPRWRNGAVAHRRELARELAGSPSTIWMTNGFVAGSRP
jgi:hypothetical protein